MAEEPGELSRLLSIHYDQPEEKQHRQEPRQMRTTSVGAVDRQQKSTREEGENDGRTEW